MTSALISLTGQTHHIAVLSLAFASGYQTGKNMVAALEMSHFCRKWFLNKLITGNGTWQKAWIIIWTASRDVVFCYFFRGCESTHVWNQTERTLKSLNGLFWKGQVFLVRVREHEDSDHQLVSLSLPVFVRESIVQPYIISCLVLVSLTFMNSQSSEKLDSWNWECSVGTVYTVRTICAGHRWNYYSATELEFVSILKHGGFLNLIILHFKKEALWNVLTSFDFPIDDPHATQRM